MKHYVIVNDWANEYESGTNVLGVTHSLEEAKEIREELIEAGENPDGYSQKVVDTTRFRFMM